MKLAGNRLRLGAAALLTMAGRAPRERSSHPDCASAGTSSVSPSVERPETNNKCYAQVTQYKYQSVQDSSTSTSQERTAIRLKLRSTAGHRLDPQVRPDKSLGGQPQPLDLVTATSDDRLRPHRCRPNVDRQHDQRRRRTADVCRTPSKEVDSAHRPVRRRSPATTTRSRRSRCATPRVATATRTARSR